MARHNQAWKKRGFGKYLSFVSALYMTNNAKFRIFVKYRGMGEKQGIDKVWGDEIQYVRWSFGILV